MGFTLLSSPVQQCVKKATVLLNVGFPIEFLPIQTCDDKQARFHHQRHLIDQNTKKTLQDSSASPFLPDRGGKPVCLPTFAPRVHPCPPPSPLIMREAIV